MDFGGFGKLYVFGDEDAWSMWMCTSIIGI